MSEGEWRGETKAWEEGKGRIYSDMKIPESRDYANVILLSDPKPITTKFGKNFAIVVGYLDGNAIYVVKTKGSDVKVEHPAEAGGIYNVWLGKTLTQALVNNFPDEDDGLTGNVIRMGRKRVTGGTHGAYLGYTVEILDDYNEALANRVVEKYNADQEGAPEEGKTTSPEVESNQDLEVAFQLLNTSLMALGEMTYGQIGNFLKSRKESGLMKTELTADEAANYCVSKDPDKYAIETRGKEQVLVIKS